MISHYTVYMSLTVSWYYQPHHHRWHFQCQIDTILSGAGGNRTQVLRRLSWLGNWLIDDLTTLPPPDEDRAVLHPALPLICVSRRDSVYNLSYEEEHGRKAANSDQKMAFGYFFALNCAPRFLAFFEQRASSLGIFWTARLENVSSGGQNIELSIRQFVLIGRLMILPSNTLYVRVFLTSEKRTTLSV